jgi:DNA-binding CsgD family transcriptional regulator
MNKQLSHIFFRRHPLTLFFIALGLGAALMAAEGNRMTTLWTVTIGGDFFVVNCVTALTLLGLFFLYLRFGQMKRFAASAVVVVGSLMSVALLINYDQGIWDFSLTMQLFSSCCIAVCEGVMLFFWARLLYELGVRRTAVAFGLSLLAYAALSGLSMLLKTDAALVVYSLLPLCSSLCLCYCRVSAPFTSPHEASTDEDGKLFEPVGGGYRSFILTMAIPIGLYALIFGNIHYQWVQLQDNGVVSLAVQLGATVGTALAGLLTLLLVRLFWSRESLEQFRYLILPIVLLALWVSFFINPTWIFLYLVLLNLAQKLVYLLIMLAPFMIARQSRHLLPWCLAFLAFTLGKTLSGLLTANMNESVFSVSSIVIAFALLILTALSTLLATRERAAARQVALAADVAASGEQAVAAPAPGGQRLQMAVAKMARHYRLTKREEEILVMLIKGRTASAIAEKLIISPATAKTHLRSIYAKTGVHSQQQLITIAEELIKEGEIKELV